MLIGNTSSLINKFIPESHWEETKKPVPSFDLLLNDIWRDGVKTGMKAVLKKQKESITKKFQENLLKATSTSEELFNRLERETNLGCTKMLLKIQNIKFFETLITVSFDSYLTDERKKGYEIARQIRSESIKEDFSIIFTFIPESKKFNKEAVTGDGFYLEYAPK